MMKKICSGKVEDIKEPDYEYVVLEVNESCGSYDKLQNAIDAFNDRVESEFAIESEDDLQWDQATGQTKYGDLVIIAKSYK